MIEAEFVNAGKQLMPGMFVSAKLALKPIGRPVVPDEALQKTEDGWRVFAIRNNMAEEKRVETGSMDGAWVEVRAGLKLGDKIILKPDAKLKDGSPVRI